MEKAKIRHPGGRPPIYKVPMRATYYGEAAMIQAIIVLGGGSFSAGVALLYTMHLKRGAGRARNGRGRGD